MIHTMANFSQAVTLNTNDTVPKYSCGKRIWYTIPFQKEQRTKKKGVTGPQVIFNNANNLNIEDLE